jgi:phosphoglycolate phosphatase-like HAD superfamily hydrolase
MGDVLVLWDVDGTLLNAGGVGGDLYEMVFSSMFGRPCEKLAPMAGRTDRAIILDTLEMAGIPEPRRHVDLFIAGLRSRAPGMFEAVQQRGRALPGAAEAVLAVASARVASSTIGFTVTGAALAEPDGLADAVGAGPASGLIAGPIAGPESAGLEPAGLEPAGLEGDMRAGDERAGGIPVSLIPAPARVAAGGVPAGASVTAAVSVGAPAGTQPSSAVLPLAVSTEAVLAPASLPVSAPTVQVAPHPATKAAAAAAAAAAVALPPADSRRHPVTIAADLPSPYGRRRPESGRVFQSVLTGNVRTLAEVKLSAVGLRYPLDLCIGAYGDDHEVRTELVHLARRRASAVHGRPPSDFGGQATVVVGDTPLDIAAALAAGARAVGVATGGYPASALLEAGAHAVLTDLTNTAAVLSAFLA